MPKDFFCEQFFLNFKQKNKDINLLSAWFTTGNYTTVLKIFVAEFLPY